MQHVIICIACLFSSILLNAQTFGLPSINAAEHVMQHETQRQEVLQYRLTNMLIEEYELGLWEKTDSILYVYDPAFPRGHNNFDFIEFSNFTYEPWYSISEWMQYDAGAWEGYYKYYGNFDASGLRTSINIDNFDGVGYVGNSRVEYTYDAANHVDTMLFLDYDGGSYDPYNRYIYTYSDDRLANMVQQGYGADWINSLLVIYTYTPEGRIDNLVYQGWDGLDWYNQTRIIYSYDASGNITEKLFQYDDLGWVTYGRYLYTYDAAGFNTAVEAQSYDGVDFLPYQLFEFTEFADGLPATNTVSIWDGFIWVDDYKSTFFYESYDDGTVGLVATQLNSSMHIYPNPTTDYFNLSFDAAGAGKVSMNVTNASGQCVQRSTWEAAPGPNRIEQSIPANWTPGLYQVTLTIGGMQESQVLVVE
jgi:hypothetical protein